MTMWWKTKATRCASGATSITWQRHRGPVVSEKGTAPRRRISASAQSSRSPRVAPRAPVTSARTRWHASMPCTRWTTSPSRSSKVVRSDSCRHCNAPSAASSCLVSSPPRTDSAPGTL